MSTDFTGMMTNNDLENALHPGRYRHYKGKEYRVIGVVLHHETRERFVLYIPLYDDGIPTIREFTDFFARMDPSKSPQKTRFMWVGK